jgi:hypothetical protein
MAEINLQRRSTGAWIWLLALVGAILLLWALVRGFDREPQMLPGTPAVHMLGDPQHVAMTGVISPAMALGGRDTNTSSV